MTTPQNVESDLGWALGTVMRNYLRAVDEVVADVPGGPRGYQVLAACGREGPRTQLALARQLGIDRTVMTYLLDDLESAGLVRREPDPNDRRARRVVATPAGHERLEELHQRQRRVEDLLLAGLPQAAQEAFRTALQQIA